MKPPILTVAALAALSVVGCATYDPNDYYDPNATTKQGRIQSKMIEHWEYRMAADKTPKTFNAYQYGAAGVITAALLQNLMGLSDKPDSQIPVYAYGIGAEHGERLVVYSEYPGFAVGECVKVFLSSRPDYPRMAYGGNCD